MNTKAKGTKGELNTDKKKQGKKNRAAGRRFESKVRSDLETNGWFVAKWTNNVELEKISDNNDSSCIIGKLKPATKWKFNPFTKSIMAVGTGFPDFIVYKRSGNEVEKSAQYEVIGVECKSHGYLDKEEKIKCKWLLINHVFSKILIAKKGKKRGELVYEEFDKVKLFFLSDIDKLNKPQSSLLGQK